MKRALMVSALTAAALAGCSTYSSPEYAEAKILSPVSTYGVGTVRGVSVVPFRRAEESPSGGGSTRVYSLFIVMDNGATQTVEVTNPTLLPDERVQITPEGRLLRLSGTTLKG